MIFSNSAFAVLNFLRCRNLETIGKSLDDYSLFINVHVTFSAEPEITQESQIEDEMMEKLDLNAVYSDNDEDLLIPEFIKHSHYTVLWREYRPTISSIRQIYESMLRVLLTFRSKNAKNCTQKDKIKTH